jgi:hypothetical protein
MSNSGFYFILFFLRFCYHPAMCEEQVCRLREKKRIDNKRSVDNYYLEILKQRKNEELFVTFLFLFYDKIQILIVIL